MNEQKSGNYNDNSTCVVCECKETSCHDKASKREKLLESLECERGTCCATEKELQEIYHNALLGKLSVEILRPLSKDKRFRNLLLRQYKEYSAIAKEVEQQASVKEVELQDVSMMSKAMMHLTTMVNTISDKSNSKLSEIMIQGINMGIISTTKIVNKIEDENKDCPYARRLLDLLSKNLEEMKLFL